MVKLHDAGTGELIGEISEQQLQFLVDHLEEESSEDRDYYINAATLDMFQSDGADAELISMLRTAMGARQDMDIRWDSNPAKQ